MKNEDADSFLDKVSIEWIMHTKDNIFDKNKISILCHSVHDIA